MFGPITSSKGRSTETPPKCRIVPQPSASSRMRLPSGSPRSANSNVAPSGTGPGNGWMSVRRKIQPCFVSAAASTRPSAPDAPVNRTGFFVSFGTELSVSGDGRLDAYRRRTVSSPPQFGECHTSEAVVEKGASWTPAARYPDPAVQVLDPSFSRYHLPLAAVERLATGFRWCEGPVWFGDGRYLLWSDIPNNRIINWEAETGAVSVFRRPSNYANGNTRDRQGRLVTCEH